MTDQKLYSDEDMRRWMGALDDAQRRCSGHGERGYEGPSQARHDDWFAVQVETRREQKARDKVAALGFPTLLPDYQVFVKGKDGRRETESRVLFPGYLLTCFDLNLDRWGKINEQDAVVGLLKHTDGTPWPIPERGMAHLLGALALGEFNDKPPEALKPGTSYRVESGRFQGHWIKFNELRPRERFAGFVRMFGGDVIVELPLLDLRLGR